MRCNQKFGDRGGSGARRRDVFRSAFCEKYGGANAWRRLLFRSAQDQSHGVREPLPINEFGLQLSAALSGKRIKFCLAAGFRFAPIGSEPAAVFQAVKRGIERALGDLEEVLGDLLDALGDGVAMNRTQRDDLEDEHVESSLEEL